MKTRCIQSLVFKDCDVNGDFDSGDETSPNSECNDEDDELRFPTQLPAFSNKIEAALKEGPGCWNDQKIKAQLKAELAIFFTSNKYKLKKVAIIKRLV